jgi:hypothetical protein
MNEFADESRFAGPGSPEENDRDFGCARHAAKKVDDRLRPAMTGCAINRSRAIDSKPIQWMDDAPRRVIRYYLNVERCVG